MKIAVLCLSALVLTGCPREKRGVEGAKTAVSLAAETVAVVDELYADLYVQAHLKVQNEVTSEQEYVLRMQRWNRGVDALKAVKLSVFMLETSLYAWEAGADRKQFDVAVQCFLGSLVYLDAVFDEIGVQLPKDFLGQAIAVAVSVLGVEEIDPTLCQGETP